jgi:hypothetical protein
MMMRTIWNWIPFLTSSSPLRTSAVILLFIKKRGIAPQRPQRKDEEGKCDGERPKERPHANPQE